MSALGHKRKFKNNKQNNTHTHTNTQCAYNLHLTTLMRAELGKLSSISVTRQRPMILKRDTQCGKNSAMGIPIIFHFLRTLRSYNDFIRFFINMLKDPIN